MVTGGAPSQASNVAACAAIPALSSAVPRPNSRPSRSVASNGFEAATPGNPEPAVAEDGRPSGPTEPAYGANAGSSADPASTDDPTTPPTGDHSTEDAETSPQPSASGVLPPRPHSVLGWIAYPFVVFWRFLFPKKPRPFIVELPFLVVFALFRLFVVAGKPLGGVPILFVSVILAAGLLGEWVARAFSEPMNRRLRRRFSREPGGLGSAIDA